MVHFCFKIAAKVTKIKSAMANKCHQGYYLCELHEKLHDFVNFGGCAATLILLTMYVKLQPDYKLVAANCNLWRNYNDISVRIQIHVTIILIVMMHRTHGIRCWG